MTNKVTNGLKEDTQTRKCTGRKSVALRGKAEKWIFKNLARILRQREC